MNKETITPGSLNDDNLDNELFKARADLEKQADSSSSGDVEKAAVAPSASSSNSTQYVLDSHKINPSSLTNASEFAQPNSLPNVDAVSSEDFGIVDQQIRTLAFDMRENRMSLAKEKIALSALPFTEAGRVAIILQNERGLDLLTNILKESTRDLFFGISSSIRRWAQERSDLMPLLAMGGKGGGDTRSYTPSYYSLSFTRAGSIVLQSIVAGLSDEQRKAVTAGSDDGLVVDGNKLKEILVAELDRVISGKSVVGILDTLRDITLDISSWDALLDYENQFADAVMLVAASKKSKVLSDDLSEKELEETKEDIRAFATVFLRDYCTAFYTYSASDGSLFEEKDGDQVLRTDSAKKVAKALAATYFKDPSDKDVDTNESTNQLDLNFKLSSFYSQLAEDLDRQIGRNSKHVISLRSYTDLVRYTHELRDTIIAQVKDSSKFADSSLSKSTELMRSMRTTLNLVSAATTKEDAITTVERFVATSVFKSSMAGLLYNLSQSSVMVDAQHIDEVFAIMTDAELVLSFNDSPIADLGTIRFSGSPVPVAESMRLSNDITFHMEGTQDIKIGDRGNIEIDGFSAYDGGAGIFDEKSPEVQKIHRLLATSILGSNRVRADIMGGKHSGLDADWSFGMEARSAVGTVLRQLMTAISYQFAIVRMSHRAAAADQISQLYNLSNYASGLIEFGLSEYHHIGRLDVIKTRISDMMSVCDTAIGDLLAGTTNLVRKRSDEADSALNGRVLPFLNFKSMERPNETVNIDAVFVSLIKMFQSTANYTQLKSQVEFMSTMMVRKGQQAVGMLIARDVMSLPEKDFVGIISNIDEIFSHTMQTTEVDAFAGLKASRQSAKELRERSLQVGDKRVYAFHLPIATMMEIMTPKTKKIVDSYNETMRKANAHENSRLPSDILITAQSAIARRLSSHFISHNLVERRSLYAALTKGQAPLRFLSYATSSLEGISHGMTVNEVPMSVSDTKQMFRSILEVLGLTPNTPVKAEQAALIIDQVNLCSAYAAYPLRVRSSFKFKGGNDITYNDFLEPNTDFQITHRKMYDVTRSLYLRHPDILKMIAADTVRVDYSKGQEVMAIDSIGTIRPIKDLNATTIQLAGSFNFYMGRILTDDHADAVIRNLGRALVAYLTV